ncbi:MAG: pyridoxal 5'-phosphate synthase glutaminase subunit PdxT [Oscillospiraceae bacterium]
MTVGVLALQGAFIEHEKMLAGLGADSFEIRQKSDLDRSFDRLIIPGGESTVMGKLLRELDMMDDIRKLITDGMPVFGTCAGLILLAQKIENDPIVHIGTMSIEACRNAYGRQLGSFFTEDSFNGKTIPMTFIRAPYISKAADSVEILSVTDGKLTAAREKNMLVTAFHPELNSDTTVHEYFLNM